jgi:hypothetical protein
LHNLPAKIGNHQFKPLQENKTILEYQPPTWFGFLVLIYLIIMIVLRSVPKNTHLDIVQSMLPWGLVISLPYLFTTTPSLIITPTEFSFQNSNHFISYSRITKIRIRRFFVKFEVDVYTSEKSYTLSSFTNRKDAEQLAQIILDLRDNS